MRIDLNCDIGEHTTPEGVQLDERLFALVTSANVACGGHAGDEMSMARSVDLAGLHGVGLGAHVSYPDRDGFGRRELSLSARELRSSLSAQLEALAVVAARADVRLGYVKPHGALYNRAACDRVVAETVAEVVSRHDRTLVVLGLPGSRTEAATIEHGLNFVPEAFPERGYTETGLLQPRHLPGAVIEDPEEVAERAVALATRGQVVSSAGGTVAVAASTLCLHSDHPSAHRVAQATVAALAAAGVQLRPFLDV